jgi:hypothetical protein
MQITPELLRNIAEDAVERITQANYNILAGYLTGAMVTEEAPIFGGTADIDLIFIYVGEPENSRVIEKVSDEIHLDICFHPQRDYSDRLALRTDPWLGPCLSEAIALFDPQHFLDLTQASVRGLFHRPENVYQRSKGQIESAREQWLRIQPVSEKPGPSEIIKYLSILDCACNAVALLVGEPLTKRRFLINFKKRLERINMPGLYPGILGLLGSQNAGRENLISWAAEWKDTYEKLPDESRTSGLHKDRHSYYFRAFDFIIESDQPEDVLWPLLHTWTLGAGFLSEDAPGFENWKTALSQVGLLEDGFADRVAALDAYLEQIEEAVSNWGTREGAR